jgi:hypothetical protein
MNAASPPSWESNAEFATEPPLTSFGSSSGTVPEDASARKNAAPAVMPPRLKPRTQTRYRSFKEYVDDGIAETAELKFFRV